MCWQEDIFSGDINSNDAKGEKRDHHEISLTTTTSEDEYVNNKQGTMTTSQDKDTNNKEGLPMACHCEDANNKEGTTMTCDDKDTNNKKGKTTTSQDDSDNKQMTATQHCTALFTMNAFPVTEKYKRTTGNRLQIQQSVRDKYCVYR
jgi:hypothetical protein